MVKLIRGLISSGALDKATGEALLAQAQTEAFASQQAAQQATQQAAATPPAGAPRVEAGDVRVPYIPQTVRDEIRDEVKGEVMAQARRKAGRRRTSCRSGPSASTSKAICACATSRASTRATTTTSRSTLPRSTRAATASTSTNTSVALPPLLNTRENRTNQCARPLRHLRRRLRQHQGRRARGRQQRQQPGVDQHHARGGPAKKDIWLDRAGVLPGDRLDERDRRALRAALRHHRHVVLAGPESRRHRRALRQGPADQPRHQPVRLDRLHSAGVLNDNAPSNSRDKMHSEYSGCSAPVSAPTGRSTVPTACAARSPTTISTISTAACRARARSTRARRAAIPTGRGRPSCRRAIRSCCCAISR